MTSKSIFPSRLTKIDELTRTDHWYLDEGDACYFIGEYTARKPYSFSATNQVIKNFKKGLEKRQTAEWIWKAKAIQQCAAALRGALDDNSLDAISFVPVPPSKCKTDPLYDDRMLQLLRQIRPRPSLDIRELVLQEKSSQAAHEQEVRPTISELQAGYRVQRNLVPGTRPMIAIVDDVLTSGTHFKAIQGMLRMEVPSARIIGLFLARRAPESSD